MKKLALQFETATTTMLFLPGGKFQTKHCKNIFVKPREYFFQIPLQVYRDGLEEILGLCSFFSGSIEKIGLIAQGLEYFT